MQRRGLWLGVLIGLVIGLGAQAVPVRSSSEETDALAQQFFKPMIWLIDKIDQNYVEEADHQKLLVGAYQGMLSSLDRYSAYWPAETVQEFEADLEGEFGGLGIVIAWDPVNKVIRVEQTIAGTPAAKHGVLAEDLIVQAKEESTGEVTKTESFKSVHDAVKVLRGEPGSKVTITVIHGEGGAKEEITLERELIKIPGVRAVEMVDAERKIGYIYIPYFSKPMVDDLRKAIGDLEGQGAAGLILDLRLNPGGLLKAAEDCANLFMRGGVIVSVKGRDGVEEIHRARRAAPFPDVPLVLLVDRFSASGAEIVAAALRDNGRAQVVGESSYGKASVQTIIDNPTIPGTAIKLTIARYYTPNGQLIEGKGVPPDIEVKLSEDETRKLARELSMKTEYPPISPERAAAIEKRAAEREKGSAKPAEAPNPEKKDEPFNDVQLTRAVEVMAQMLAAKTAAPAGAKAAVAVPAAVR